MTASVAWWAAQSLLAAGLVLGWLAASRRARLAGARWPMRWIFPWARVWRDGRAALVVAEVVALALYALSRMLAPGR